MYHKEVDLFSFIPSKIVQIKISELVSSINTRVETKSSNRVCGRYVTKIKSGIEKTKQELNRFFYLFNDCISDIFKVRETKSHTCDSPKMNQSRDIVIQSQTHEKMKRLSGDFKKCVSGQRSRVVSDIQRQHQIWECLKKLGDEKGKHLEREGLFRIAGPWNEVEAILKPLNKKGADSEKILAKIEDTTILTSVLKNILSKNPLMSKEATNRLIDHAQQPEKSKKKSSLSILEEELANMKPLDYALLSKLIHLLKSAAELHEKNKMTVDNLAITPGAIIMSTPRKIEETIHLPQIVTEMIESYDTLFKTKIRDDYVEEFFKEQVGRRGDRRSSSTLNPPQLVSV